MHNYSSGMCSVTMLAVITGILAAVQLVIQEGSRQNVHLCMDSKVALTTLHSMTSKLEPSLESHNTLNSLVEERTVRPY